MKKTRIYLVGFMGAGKTTIGRLLADKLGWRFVDLDKEIEKYERRTITAMFSESGEPHFRNVERECLRIVSSMERAVIALGGGAYVDPQNRALAGKTGLTVWLKVSFPQVLDRVKIDGTRPKFASRSQAEDLLKSRAPAYAQAEFHISTDLGTPQSVVDEIMGVIGRL